VKAPPALILPDPVTRFARSAGRLEALAAGHPMTEWPMFMARLTWAQHIVATTLRPFSGPQRITVERPVDARLPPLAAEGHPRDAAWREGLTTLLDTFDDRASPPPARAAVANLRARDADAVEALASRFLLRGVDHADVGAALRVAAALQVYFTRAVAGFAGRLAAVVAAALAVPLLRLDAGVGRGDRVGPKLWSTLFLLLAVRDGVEPCARPVHHLW
jgi:FdhE protein